MAFVLDASISAVWALTDESNPLASRVLDNWAANPHNPEAALVPSLWWYETRNLLVISERRKRIVATESDAFLRILGSFPIEVDVEPDENAVFRLARRHQLSFYDATYLEIAERKKLPLATLDKALRIAAEAAGVSLLA
jgi:predicted nucleic acid-binding protein